MQKKVELSIIIINFNTYSYICNCLDSIFENNLSSGQYEIIIIDNASGDNSVSLLRKKYPQVEILENKENKGFAAACNQGIKNAHGDYILLLNPDTILFPDTLEKMLNLICEDPLIGIATCRVELPSGKMDDACHRGFPTPWNSFCQFSGLASLFPHSQFFNGYHLGYQDMDKIHEIDSCVGAFMLVRKDAGDKLNWFDEDYFWYGEDIDFCFRMKKAGWKIIYAPGTKIIHYKGVSSGIKKHSKHLSAASEKTQIEATRSRFAVMKIFYQKHYLNKYPRWLSFIVLTGIKWKEQFSMRRFNHL